jgi:HrpA-like RNA helicase
MHREKCTERCNHSKPQFLLEEAAARGEPCVVVVTQPRRLACMAVAERLAVERGE